MDIVITGGAGFLGQRLLQALLQRGRLSDAGGREQPIGRITLVDVVPAQTFGDARVTAVTGDIGDPRLVETVVTPDTSSIFHLAAIVSGMAESDFDLGMRINFDGSRALAEVCRARGHRPRLVFTSSVAVYGGVAGAVVHDDTAVTPQSSYGTEKAIVELLINDYSRRGFLDGRVLRLPTICVRPGRPNAAASSFASGIIREPLNGEAAVCPVASSTRLWLMSPSKVIESLIAGHELPADALGANRIVNLPGISVSVAEMVASLERIAGAEVVKRIEWRPDPAIERIVATWPPLFETTRARSLGFRGDDNFDDMVREFLSERGSSAPTSSASSTHS